MLQKITISIIICFSLFVKLNAQTWTFAGAAGSANAENTKAICTDAAGNVYLTGSFSNTVDFDFGAGTANLTSNGSNDIFIASYTSAGAYRWAVRAGGTANDNGAPSGGICTDGTNVYVTGAYSGAATLFGSTSLTPNGGAGTDAFVAKLNASTGAWIWAISLGGSGNVDSGAALCLDPSGNPYVLGSFNGTLSGSCANVSAGGSDVFVSKLNPSTGACVWTSSGGSTGNDGTVGGGICYDPTSTELIIGSNFTTGTAIYGSFSVPLVGGIDMCVLELNSSTGAWLGAVGCGSATNDDAVACALDPVMGDVMICGAITGNVTLPGGISLTASSAGAQDAWIGRYSIASNGFTWAKSATGASNDRAHSVAIDGVGTAVMVGQYLSNPTTFGSQSLTNTNSGGFDEAFVVAYSTSTGTELWSTKNTNTGTQNTATNAKAISYAGSNNYWIAGQNVQGTTFGSTVLNSNGFNDFYIAKYNAPVTCSNPTIGTQPANKSVCFNGSTSFSISATGASSYQWQVNTGSGFTNITNGGVYSGATTATLSLTGINLPSGYLYRCIAISGSCQTISNSATLTVSAYFNTSSQTNVSCNGGSNGSATLNAAGGIAPYSYAWSPSGGTGSTASGLSAGKYTVTVTDAISCSTTRTYTITQPSALITTTAVTNIACNSGSNGSASITASGGTSPYTYLWSSAQTTSVISGQTAGVKTVTVTDANGCTSIKSINITQPATALSASNVVTNISCFGGSNGAINLTPSGGTAAYIFNWGGGITTEDRTGLLAGAYTCTITDANGCTTTSNATVTQPASALAATIISTNTACLSNTGVANVSASGGTPSYTYSWSPSGGTTATASALGVGNYTCVIMDANLCSITRTVNIVTSGSPTATITSQTNVTCNSLCNGAATVTASGGSTPYNYNWSNANTTTIATNLCAGVITCTVTGSNGCSTVVNTTITQPTVLSANSSSSAILCNGGVTTITVSATGGTPSYSGVGTFTTLAGTKSYTVTDANGCSTTTSITISQPSILSANSSASAILCNGGMSTVTISATGGTSSYSGVGTFTTLAGTKTYTVTDANGCSTTTSISVSEPSILSANATASSILCNGGISTITVSATGGISSYTGVGTFTANAGTQTYTVTDANGCSATTSISVSEPSILSANTSASSILCNGGISTITVSATGGTTSYLGVGTFTANAGTQTYTVTDANGCSTTTSVSITEPSALVSSQSVTLCTGQSITVGTSTYNTSGTYTNVLSAINGCDSTVTTNLIVNPAIVSSQTVTLCAGQSLIVGSNTYTTTGVYTNTFTAINGCDSTLTTNLTINNVIDITTTLNGLTISANESSATYQWIDCDNANQPIASETNQNFTASSNGNYAVIVTQNSCSDTSACVNISTVGIKEVNNLTGIKLYPNPTNSSFTISGIEVNSSISIYNTIGELVKSIQSTDSNTTIDLSNYSNGIYFIKIKNNKGDAIQKLIKQ